jgi:hypothetical protein
MEANGKHVKDEKLIHRSRKNEWDYARDLGIDG